MFKVKTRYRWYAERRRLERSWRGSRITWSIHPSIVDMLQTCLDQIFVIRPYKPEIYLRNGCFSPIFPVPIFHFLFPSLLSLSALSPSQWICGSTFSSYRGWERLLQPPDTFHGLEIHRKYVCCRAPAANVFLVYLELHEWVWRLQMSSYVCQTLSNNWSNCGCFLMYWMLLCSRLWNSTWLFVHFISDVV